MLTAPGRLAAMLLAVFLLAGAWLSASCGVSAQPQSPPSGAPAGAPGFPTGFRIGGLSPLGIQGTLTAVERGAHGLTLHIGGGNRPGVRLTVEPWPEEIPIVPCIGCTVRAERRYRISGPVSRLQVLRGGETVLMLGSGSRENEGVLRGWRLRRGEHQGSRDSHRRWVTVVLAGPDGQRIVALPGRPVEFRSGDRAWRFLLVGAWAPEPSPSTPASSSGTGRSTEGSMGPRKEIAREEPNLSVDWVLWAVGDGGE